MLIRKDQITKMAGQMPAGIGTQAKQAASQQATSLQQALSQAPAAPVQQATQALATQQAQQTGATQVAATNAVNQSTAALGAEQLRATQEADAQRLQRKQLEANKQNRQAMDTLANLSGELKGRLFDENLNFQRDELNRTMFNDQQLLDYKLAQGMADEDLANYEQEVRQLTERKMQMLKSAQARIVQELQNSFQAGQQELDQDQQRFLLEKKQAIEDKIRKEQAKAKNRSAMFAAAGTIVGAGAGAFFGPAGAAVGASAGGALGSLAASQTKG